MKPTLSVSPSQNGVHKWTVEFSDGRPDIHFGAKGYSDYTLHGDPARMMRYIRRHGGTIPRDGNMLKAVRSDTEKWGPRGVATAGFWSRWLLWSFPDIRDAARYIEKIVLKNKYDVILKNR